MRDPPPDAPSALLARLTAATAPRTALDALLASLRLLLNTRPGDAPAAPDYGVPDLADLRHRFPAAATALQQALRAALARHEPRLRGVEVRPVAGPALEISATFAGAPIELRVELGAEARLELT